MKIASKLLVLIALVLAMAFLGAGALSADEGPHGSYGPGAISGGGWSSTDKCAGCHRTHSGTNDSLLTAGSTTDLCRSCHGPGGFGANTDVWNGRFLHGRAGSDDTGYVGANPDQAWLNGGGFLAAWNFRGGTGAGGFAATTSRHDVAGMEGHDVLPPSGGAGLTAWGSGLDGPGIVGVLECTSCHDPHGSGNYRLLRGASNSELERWAAGSATFLPDHVYSNQVLPSSVSGIPHDYTAGTNVAYDRGISDFCSTCHTNYIRTIKNDGGELYDAGDGPGAQPRFRHPVSNKMGWDPNLNGGQGGWSYHLGDVVNNFEVPVSNPKHLRRVNVDNTATNGTWMTCLTCHFSHGSAAQTTGEAAGVAPSAGSALLFLDNRGICQSCHNMAN